MHSHSEIKASGSVHQTSGRLKNLSISFTLDNNVPSLPAKKITSVRKWALDWCRNICLESPGIALIQQRTTGIKIQVSIKCAFLSKWFESIYSESFPYFKACIRNVRNVHTLGKVICLLTLRAVNQPVNELTVPWRYARDSWHYHKRSSIGEWRNSLFSH